MNTVEQILTNLDRATWVVDNAVIHDLPQVDDRGKIIPGSSQGVPGAGVLAHEYLAKVIRRDGRGVARRGLTTRLFLILQITAAFEGTAGIRSMHALATGCLPRELKWELDILTRDPITDAVHELSDKQLYRMGDAIHLALDPADPERSPEQNAHCRAAIRAISTALNDATKVISPTSTSYAVDESGVWAWSKGKRKPKDIPPHDHIEALTPQQRKLRKERGLTDPEITAEQVEMSQEIYGPKDEDALTADDTGTTLDEHPEPEEEPSTMETNDAEPTEGQGKTTQGTVLEKKAKRSKECTFAAWGGKTHKTGRITGYYGYGLHALVRVPDLIREGRAEPSADTLAGPLLFEEFTITPASTDVVDLTLDMVRRVHASGHTVKDLLADRHYSYKKYDRWVSRLWRMGVRAVIDMRKDNHGEFDYNGAIIIDGTPHCGVPEGLKIIEAPGLGASAEAIAKFTAKINERQQYAMELRASAWTNDGTTRWACPAVAGTVGCPRRPGTMQTARELNQPIVEPPETILAWCENGTSTIKAIPQMKYHQEDYWGNHIWNSSYNRRTHVEGKFGTLKNHRTGNIHRGFMQLTGEPLVTFALTAAVVAENLRELENWYTRASVLRDPKVWVKLRKGQKERAAKTKKILATYEEHPLHRTTIHRHGFTMLTESQKDELDATISTATTPTDDDLAA